MSAHRRQQLKRARRSAERAAEHAERARRAEWERTIGVHVRAGEWQCACPRWNPPNRHRCKVCGARIAPGSSLAEWP